LSRTLGKLRLGLIGSIVAAGSFLAAAGEAQAQNVTCIKQHNTKPADQPLDSLEIGAQQAGDLIMEIATQLGIARGLEIITCDILGVKAEAYYADGRRTGVPQGEYIIYSTDWVREVIGDNRTQALVLFGHELGHFVNRHHTTRSNLPRKEMEMEADVTSGCAVARLKGDWREAASYLSRTRKQVDDLYPNREESLAALQKGFTDCGGIIPLPTCRIPENGIEYWAFEKDETGHSDWMEGGHSQPEYCAAFKAQLLTQYPDAQQVGFVTSSESTRDTCAPFRCIEYQYHCTLKVRRDPVYREAESAQCK
jgi:hypothetical protein